MNKIHYEINETDLVVSEESVISYGISCIEGEKLVSKVQDLSPNKAEIEKLVNLCNELKLEPCHLNDIAEDFIV